MNRHICKAFLCLCLPVIIIPLTRAEEINLLRAYELALVQSETLQISVAEWRAAEARYRQSLGAMWPEISAKGESAWTSERDAHRAGVGVTWVVFDGFRTAREAESRQAEGLARYHDSAHARVLLYEDVADVFYQTLSFQEQRAAVMGQLKALEERLAELERRRKIGRSKQSDLLTTSTQIAEARLTIEQLNQFCAAALELLAFVTGQPASGLQVADQTPLPALDAVDKYLAAAASREDIKAGEARVEASQSDIKVAEADRAPKVTLDGNAYLLRSPQSQGEWDMVLRLELPLFDRGRRVARVAEAGQQLRISELRLAQLQRSSELDVRQAYQSLFYELRQWSEMQTATGVAAESLALSRKDYELGRVSNLDVLVASVQYWVLRRREAALAQQLRADMIHLHVAAGKVSP
jgi:outer membrane protein TolC